MTNNEMEILTLHTEISHGLSTEVASALDNATKLYQETIIEKFRMIKAGLDGEITLGDCTSCTLVGESDW